MPANESLSRREAREILEIVLTLSRSHRGMRSQPYKAREHWENLLAAEGRVLKLLGKLSQPQSLGSPQG
jgi:hypothetical protein